MPFILYNGSVLYMFVVVQRNENETMNITHTLKYKFCIRAIQRFTKVIVPKDVANVSYSI